MILLFQTQTTFATRILQLIVASLLLTQYIYLFSAATLLSPTQWPDALPRLFYNAFDPTLNLGCTAPFPPELPATEIQWHKVCNLTFAQTNQKIYRWLGGGIQSMDATQRRMLFDAMDVNNDGILRWDEFSALFTPVRNATEIVGTDVGLLVMNIADPSQPVAILRLQYFAEVFGRVQSYTSPLFGGGGWWSSVVGRQVLGNGVDEGRTWRSLFVL
ncbi:hypothetical protein HDU98_000252 [Podochytrium sp. JEL0797]|nr:hypothetical protein HDU98_000252 [Podochytrium sp. JEL0797]